MLLKRVLAFSATIILPIHILFAATIYVVDESAIFEKAESGQILIVSELHGHEPHHDRQRDLLVKISGAKFPISVGMEFFEYPQQNYVNQYVAGDLLEDEFLKLIGWGSISFDNYRFQARFPYWRGGQTLALNLPRSISGKVSKNGLASLSPEEAKLLPPNYARGEPTYFERFRDVMKGHASEEQIENYFMAQSLWDDTMSWRAAEFIKENPDHLLMIIVGDFHVAYRDGLISRLKSRGVENVLSISQVDSEGLSETEKKELIAPHGRYGARADFVIDVQ
jgi:uncharacterized iron-regulated protein